MVPFFGMDKPRPTYDVEAFKSAVAEGRADFTQSAVSGARALGYGLAEMKAAIAAMTRRQFYKSMTSLADHRVWQDVYRPVTSAGKVYLKLTVMEDVLIVSFKEL